MDSLKYILKMLLWSVGISIGMKIVFGMYSVFGVVSLFIPLTVGIISAASLTRSKNTFTVLLSSIHILLVAGFTILADNKGFLLSLASDSASFFSKISGKGVIGTNVFWSIMIVLGTYYIAFILTSLIISAALTKDSSLISEESEDDEYEEEVTSKKAPSHRKKK